MKIAQQDENGNPKVRDATPEEIAALQPTAYQITCEGWQHMDYALRIVVSKTLIQQYREILIFKSYFEVMGLPIEILSDEIHLYCNEILEDDNLLLPKWD